MIMMVMLSTPGKVWKSKKKVYTHKNTFSSSIICARQAAWTEVCEVGKVLSAMATLPHKEKTEAL